VVDKADLRVPAHTPFSGGFQRLYSDLAANPKLRAFKSTPYYSSVADLRPFGYEAILHMHCLRDREGNHKLELVDTGQQSYAGMQHTAESIFDVNPKRLGVMRLDLAADVRGVPVDWFFENARFMFKRFAAEIGKQEYTRMGMRAAETLYFGTVA
jgi:hypothetical protein